MKDGEVLIVDEFTGRLMPGRRWSDGLHQAVEAKEGVKIERENQTLATITFQNYFRMYKKLAGMTGTAETEARRVRQDLQAGSDGHSHQQHAAPASRMPTSSTAPRRKSTTPWPTRSASCTRAASRCWWAPLRLKNRSGSRRSAEEERRQARGAERQVPRARSRDRGPGRPQGRGDHRHQHGRPRHRHSAGRQPRVHGQAGVRQEGPRAAGARSRRRGRRRGQQRRDDHVTGTTRAPSSQSPPRQWHEMLHQVQGGDRRGARRGGRRRRAVHPRHRAPRGAAHRQPACADAPAARAIPAHRASISRWKTT